MSVLFNLDLHVSVIEDVAEVLDRLGHVVDSHLLSGHAWALGKRRASSGTGSGVDGKVGYGPVNLATWEGLVHEPNDTTAITRMGRRLREECPELETYDGYVCTYPPAFALLYEEFTKPIVVVMPVRYDLLVTNFPDKWHALNAFLAEKRVTVVGNSLYDARYYEYFTDRAAEHVPSQCAYVDRLAPGGYEPSASYFLAFGEHAGCREAEREVPGVRFIRGGVLPDPYRHDDVRRARGIVWVPYNVSIMSFFEHYRMAIPLFVPSERFLVDLWRRGLAMSQHSWHGLPTGGSRLPRAGTDLPDPCTEEGFRVWLPLADFYNREELPHVTYFDSWDDLRQKIAEADLAATSAKMRVTNEARYARALGQWSKITGRVEGYRP